MLWTLNFLCEVWKTLDWGGKGGQGGGMRAYKKYFWRDSIFIADDQEG